MPLRNSRLSHLTRKLSSHGGTRGDMSVDTIVNYISRVWFVHANVKRSLATEKDI
jgi:hypothetical protein